MPRDWERSHSIIPFRTRAIKCPVTPLLDLIPNRSMISRNVGGRWFFSIELLINSKISCCFSVNIDAPLSHVATAAGDGPAALFVVPLPPSSACVRTGGDERSFQSKPFVGRKDRG